MAETNGTAPEIADQATIQIPLDEIATRLGQKELQAIVDQQRITALEQQNQALAAELARVNALASEAGIELAPVEAPSAP